MDEIPYVIFAGRLPETKSPWYFQGFHPNWCIHGIVGIPD